MRFIITGKGGSYVNAIEPLLNIPTDSELLVLKPSEIKNFVTDGVPTKIIYIHITFMQHWDYWMFGDIRNEYNNKKFIEEVLEYRDFGKEDCDCYKEFNGTGLNDLAEDINYYIKDCITNA